MSTRDRERIMREKIIIENINLIPRKTVIFEQQGLIVILVISKSGIFMKITQLICGTYYVT